MRQELIDKLLIEAEQCRKDYVETESQPSVGDVPYFFIEGAKWIIANVWHDASELHDKERVVIVKLINNHYGFWKGSFTDGKIERNFNLHSVSEVGTMNKGIVSKWCYLEDIIPDETHSNVKET